MIDIHCHILPGLDDGAQTKEEALKMALAAESEGITHILATPHHKNRAYNNPRQVSLNAVDELNTFFQSEGLGLEVLPGQECRIFGEVLEDYQNGEILTVNDNRKYLLVEFPSNHVPRYTERLFFDLQVAGITPVIVHPERNSEIIQTPEILYNLVNGGALTQVTAASLIGKFGKKIGQFSHQLVAHGLTHLLASDAHNTTTRGFCLREAYEVLGDTYGHSLRLEFEENAAHLIDGEPLYVNQPERIKQKKFLGLF
jgi:protein-tyrosine phosphatase